MTEMSITTANVVTLEFRNSGCWSVNHSGNHWNSPTLNLFGL